MSISADTLRGHTDTFTLALRVITDSFGFENNKNVQRCTGGRYEFKEATLYTAFKRLEQGGMITSYWGEDGPGARRRYYAITEEGRRQWRESSEEWKETRMILDALLTLEVEYESN